MKFKKILMCTLAAGLLLTGCSDSGKDGGNTKMEITSSKPAEIDGFKGNVENVAPKSGDLIATFEIEGFGTIKAVLFPEAAPVGVENFQKLADSGYFKNLNIHRVVADFMLQGGSLNGNGTGGDAMVNGGEFGIETTQNARHFYGALCYANAQGQNSTQFYIVNNKIPQDLDDFDIPRYEQIVQQGKDYMAASRSDAEREYYRFQGQYYQNTVDWVNYASDEIKARYKEKGGTPFLDGNYTVFGQVYEGFDVVDRISEVLVTYNDNGTEMSKPVQDIIIKNVTVTVF